MLAWTESTTPRREPSSERSGLGSARTSGAKTAAVNSATKALATHAAVKRRRSARARRARALEGDVHVIGGAIRDGCYRRVVGPPEIPLEEELVGDVLVVVARARVGNRRVLARGRRGPVALDDRVPGRGRRVGPRRPVELP